MKAIEIFRKNIGRADSLFDAHRKAFPKGKPPADWTSDVLRASLIFSVASFDAYMHDKISEIIPSLIKNKKSNLPGSLIEALKQFVSYEKLLKIFFEERPHEHFRTAIKKFYKEKTIQDIGDIEKVIKVLGISDFWFKLANILNNRPGRIKKLSKASVKKLIQPYVERRHKIVHEADLYTSKYKRASMRVVKIDFIKKAIKDIKLFTEGIDKVISKEYQI